jgi:catechol 2,3-dioxygenase-like lactoylglutathione lyase family enzyme
MPAVDERPPVWVGHVVMAATDVRKTAGFWDAIGLRSVYDGDDMAIFELRGGTHLLVFPSDAAPPGVADPSFDMMVDDLVATHAEWAGKGLDVSPIADGFPGGHSAFQVKDPDGNEMTVYNTHVEGVV